MTYRFTVCNMQTVRVREEASIETQSCIKNISQLETVKSYCMFPFTEKTCWSLTFSNNADEVYVSQQQKAVLCHWTCFQHIRFKT